MNNSGADVVVLGAGPAGIGAGIALGDSALVLERNAEPGGLCSTIELDGALFDLGGHSFHTPHPEIRELVFSALEMEEQPRNAWCFVGGDWIPYPFQKHFTQLSDAMVVAECEAGLASADRSVRCANFDEFLEHRFGAGITRHFMRPYNEKLWGPDLTRLAADWTGERVAGPANIVERFLPGGGKRTPLQSDTKVAYPARGGFGEIFRALAQRLQRLRLGVTVVGIDPRTRKLRTANAESIAWKEIVSTLPLPKLLALLPEVPAIVREDAARLVALPVSLVLLALDGRLDTTLQRVYCAGTEIAGHKIVLNHNSSDGLRSRPRHGIQAEVSVPGGKRESDEKLIERAIAGVLTLGLLRQRGQVHSARVIHLAQGYPVPTHDRAAVVGRIRGWLAGIGIHSVGRFGGWAYINSDEALHRGFVLGNELAGSASTESELSCEKI